MKYYDREHREVESAPLLKNAIKEWCKRNNFNGIETEIEKENIQKDSNNENR